MTDDLAKYESLAKSLDEGWPSTPRPAYFEIAAAITELVAMVREARERIQVYVDANEAYIERAEAAERELAELKRKMREPDASIIEDALEAYVDYDGKADEHWGIASMRAAWLAGVNHLLGDKE